MDALTGEALTMDGLAPAPPISPTERVIVTDTTRRIVTGNRLRDGVPIYFIGDGSWSPSVAAARHVAAEAAAELLAEAQAAPAPHPAIGLAVIDVALVEGAPRPLSLRERIRAFGPTAGKPSR
jgi:hypothetical protein